MSDASPAVRDQIDAVYRAESRRVLATLIRLLGDFDLAEEALQDAFVEAVERWPATGRAAALDGARRLSELIGRDSHFPPDCLELGQRHHGRVGSCRRLVAADPHSGAFAQALMRRRPTQ